MQQDTIYVLHKNGAKSHYIGLEYLLNQSKFKIKHREFSVASKFFKALIGLNFSLFKKQCINCWFLLSLRFSKNKKIVFGIAPFDSRIIKLSKFLNNHKVFYHTSWTYWDKTFHPKNPNNSKEVFETWRKFLEDQVLHIFAVTNQTKDQLLENYAIPKNKISVVYHSLDPAFVSKFESKRVSNSFIYLGRLVPQKGIKEILDYFSKNQNLKLTIVGSGKLDSIVKKYCLNYNNIIHKPHSNNKMELAEILSKHEYLLLNSKRNNKWEELFGMIIIEAMAQGMVPIATNHSGPKEIISKDIGYLFDEGNLESTLNIITEKSFDIQKSERAREKALFYLPQNVASFWQPVLK